MTTNVVLIRWPDASKAFEACTEVQNSGNNNVLQLAVLSRGQDGFISIKDGANNDVGFATFGGSLIGGMVGILGGPVGLLLGFSTGALFGSLVDLNEAVDDGSVISAMSKFIPPGGTALVLEVAESTHVVIDTLAAKGGGTVLRRSRDEVESEVVAAEQAARAAATEAQRVLRETKKTERKEEREAKWEKTKAKFQSAFS